MNRALEDHELAVRSELFPFTEQVLRTADKLTNNKAQQYLRYGCWTAAAHDSRRV